MWKRGFIGQNIKMTIAFSSFFRNVAIGPSFPSFNQSYFLFRTGSEQQQQLYGILLFWAEVLIFALLRTVNSKCPSGARVILKPEKRKEGGGTVSLRSVSSHLPPPPQQLGSSIFKCRKPAGSETFFPGEIEEAVRNRVYCFLIVARI